MSGSGLDRRELRWRLWQQLPLLVALVLLWVLVWGELSPLSVLSGVVVAVATSRLFYLPPVELSGRIHIGWLLVLLARLAVQIVAGSFVVAVQAFLPGAPRRRNAIIAVPLHTSSDFVLTMTAILVTIVPGSLVIELDRERATIYAHVLGAGDAGAERARGVVLAAERAVVRAIGSREDVRKALAP